VEGLAVFVDKAIPLDFVIARIIKRKKNYAEARVHTMLKASPFRIDPPCMYSGFCGGCKWQFLNYDKQIEYKQQHVVESIERIGLIRDVPVHPTIPSPAIFGYRNQIEDGYCRTRWAKRLLTKVLLLDFMCRGPFTRFLIPGNVYFSRNWGIIFSMMSEHSSRLQMLLFTAFAVMKASGVLLCLDILLLMTSGW
jgi:hypothetical protein